MRFRNLMITSLLLGTAINAHASNPACDTVGGAVVFKNSLYGLGIGALLGGLGLAVAGDADNAGQVVAGGALVGMIGGIGFGVYEVSNRDCNQQRPDYLQRNEYKFQSSAVHSFLEQPLFKADPLRKHDVLAFEYRYAF